MSAKDRQMRAMALAGIASVFVFGSGSVFGQSTPDGRVPLRTKTAPRTPPQSPVDNTPALEGKVVRVPVNPSDTVAIINGEIITRAQLAEEAFVREGEKVLDAMISRKLLDQAMKARKLIVTPQEVDAEVDKYANSIAGVTREEWLRNLQKERKISPIQYKNDIIYPGLALKKLAENRVQVTDKDMKEYLEAQFGEKLRCRIIMTMRERDAMEIWKKLKENPAGFAKIATDDQRSMDQATKPNGGLLEQPLTRHAYPREVSDKAFMQLVDGEAQDKDPAHKPKDGDISGPIQVTPETWIIVKREALTPAQQHDPKNPDLVKMMHNAIFDAKLKEAMGEVFDELIAASQVENKLTGQIKMASEDRLEGGRMDKNVKLMSDPAANLPRTQPSTSTNRPKATAASVNPDDRAAAEAFKKNASGPTSKK